MIFQGSAGLMVMYSWLFPEDQLFVAPGVDDSGATEHFYIFCCKNNDTDNDKMIAYSNINLY